MSVYPELADDRAAGRLTTRLPDGVALDRVTWGMLSHNAVPGVAPVRRTQLDDHVVLTFEAPGVPLSRRMETPLRKDDVLQLLEAMTDAVLATDRHMIPTASLLYDPEKVFVDDAGGVVMLCVPVEGADHGDPVGFMKRVIFNLRYDPQDDTSYVSDLINVLGGSPAGDVSKLSRLLRATRVSDAGGRARHAQAPADPVAPVPPAPAPVPGATPWGGAQAAPAREVPRPVAADAARAGGPGFAVPGGAPVPAGAPTAARPAAPAAVDDEDDISLAYLLQHYSKENKERYDRARKARAAAKASAQAADGAGAPPPPVPAPPAPGQPAPGAYGAPQGGAVPAPPHHGVPEAPVVPGPPTPVGAVPPVPGLPTVPPFDAGAVPFAPAPVAPGYGPGAPVVPPPAAVVDPTAHARFGLQDTSTGVTTWLTKPITVVGRRRARVDIAVADETVSKNHAIVQMDGETCSIIDNASTNGVEVDGERIVPLEAVPLRDGSRIRVGEVVLVLLDRATW